EFAPPSQIRRDKLPDQAQNSPQLTYRAPNPQGKRIHGRSSQVPDGDFDRSVGGYPSAISRIADSRGARDCAALARGSAVLVACGDYLDRKSTRPRTGHRVAWEMGSATP